MKKLLFLIYFTIGISTYLLFADNDTISIDLLEDDCKYCYVNSLDSLLMSWFYYIGRDSITYLESHERKNFNTNISDSIFEARIKEIVTPIELSYNKAVQKYLDLYVKNGQWIAPKFIGLSYQYFPLFEEKLDAYNIPLELKYLPIVESALNPIAKSPAGATGLWQFIYPTAKGYGLEINSYIDERMDPVKSTEVACQFLRNLYDTYQDWNLVIAAYNCGPGTINNAIRRAGGKTNYWDIYPYLPNETRAYVPKYIAMVYLFNYAEKHGFKPEYIHYYDDVETVYIKKELHFAQLDSVLGISIAQSRELNPQYKLDIIPAKTKSYPLKIRRQYVSSFIELEDSIYRFQDSIYFNSKKYNYKPNEVYTEYLAPSTQPEGTVELTYTVKSGDVIGLIASWYEVKSNDLKAWNGISGNNIYVGQKLKVYIPKNAESKFKAINNMSFEEKQKKSGIEPSTNKPKEELIDPNYEYYTVKSGDNPYNIAKKLDGISVDDILKLNDVSDPSSLKIGQKLKIRKKTKK